MTLVTQVISTSHPVNLLCLERRTDAFATENVPAQASVTIFPGYVDFCTMSFVQAVFFCSGHIEGLEPDFPLFNLYKTSFSGSLGIYEKRFIHPGCVVFSSPTAS